MPDKAPYKLVVKFDGARPEKIAEALAILRDIAGNYDQAGESTATMTIESYQEAPLRATMDDFEQWLYRHAPGLVKDQAMVLYRPGLRPETAELLAREKRRTPMDDNGWEESERGPVITPEPPAMLQLSPPLDWTEAELVEPEQLAIEGTDDAVSSDAPPVGIR